MNQSKNILFLCPHGAAKSVLAMTYFADLASKADLTVVAKNAGTEPDPTINPKVKIYLEHEGFDLTHFTPPLLTQKDLTWADIIVSIGCITAEQAPNDTQFLDWSDVPMLSNNFQKSRDSIHSHVVSLVDTLANHHI